MANHRANQQHGALAETLWFLARTWRLITDIPAAWMQGNRYERGRMLEAMVIPVGWAVFMVVSGPTPVHWFFLGYLTIRGFGELADIYRSIGWRAKMARTLHRQPTGAPRVANVTCSQGRTHRFIYTDQGWQDAGPATELPTGALR